mmetsp:Transcript_49802/g.120701  ORF Transcript_49802/g.120701 Transcript_49802/m.120701 type:complete len:227 (-) Transcript_49802:160-840(-)
MREIAIPTSPESGIALAPVPKKNGIRNTPHSATSRQIFHATLNRISLTVMSTSLARSFSGLNFFHGNNETLRYSPKYSGILTLSWRMKNAATTLLTPSMISTTFSSNSLDRMPNGIATAKTTMTAKSPANDADHVMARRRSFFISSSICECLMTAVRYCPMMIQPSNTSRAKIVAMATLNAWSAFASSSLELKNLMRWEIIVFVLQECSLLAAVLLVEDDDCEYIL